MSPLIRFFGPVLATSVFTIVVLGTTPAQSQSVQFARTSESVGTALPEISEKLQARYERFLTAVFPVRAMRTVAHAHDRPVARRVTYTVVEQRGEKYILAAYSARWADAINAIAIYRVTGGPIQVWRSRPWEANYYDLHFTTAELGPRTLVLFREGGNERSFGIGSVFAFRGVKNGVYLSDLTPTENIMTVRTRFPFRPMLAQGITLGSNIDAHESEISLSASDDEYVRASGEVIHPAMHWHFDRRHNRFDISDATAPAHGVTTLLGAKR